MKYGRVITAMVCTAVLLAALCGCGDTPQEVSDPATTASTTTTTTAEETTTTTAETTADTTTATTPKSTTKKPTTTTTTKKPTTTTTAAYVPNTMKKAELTEQQKTKILTEFTQQIWNEEETHLYGSVEEMLTYFSLDGYFGEYNGYTVVLMNTFLGTTGFTEVEIDGYCFAITEGQQYYLYKESQFWKMKYGYELGMINESDLKDIWYYCYGKFPAKGSVVVAE